MNWFVEVSWDGSPFRCVYGGSEVGARATMVQCAPRWRRMGYSVRMIRQEG